MKTAGLVLAAGSSRRLGQPKQLLPFRGRTLLDASLDAARAARFDQRLVTIGGAAPEVLDTINFDGFAIVESVHHTQGCSSSIVSAMSQMDGDIDGFVLLLGDQPEVDPATISTLLAACSPSASSPIGVCRYDDGIGHPFWFGRRIFDDLARLHGDKAVWKLIESGDYDVSEVAIPGTVPLDVDTWDDYEALLESIGEPIDNLRTQNAMTQGEGPT
jgi:molybdenum cofactor cytidylyltransferase